MTRERAAELLSEVMVLDDPEMAEAHRVAISALRQQECVGDVNKSLTMDDLSERNAPVFCQSKIFRMVGIGVCAKTDTSFLQVDTDLWQKRDQTGCFTARSRRRGLTDETCICQLRAEQT